MTARSYRFGPFSLDTSSYRLLRDGLEVSLSPKHIEALLYPVARPAALVTKEEQRQSGTRRLAAVPAVRFHAAVVPPLLALRGRHNEPRGLGLLALPHPLLLLAPAKASVLSDAESR